MENWLRRQAGDAGHEGDFLQRYPLSLLYQDGLTREIQIVLGAIVVVLNLAVYGGLWQQRTIRRQSSTGNRRTEQ